jgi:hypothetical protein
VSGLIFLQSGAVEYSFLLEYDAMQTRTEAYLYTRRHPRKRLYSLRFNDLHQTALGAIESRRVSWAGM